MADPSHVSLLVIELTRPMFDVRSFGSLLNRQALMHPDQEQFFHVGTRERRCPRLGTARIDDYVEETVPRYSDPMFKAHFRMTRSSFEDLLVLVAPYTDVRTISLERRTLACIWYLSNVETFRGVADRFGLSKGSLHYYLGNFCRCMTSNEIMSGLISWPKPCDYRSISQAFLEKTGFPNVLGAVDGTHVPIVGPPKAVRDSYICRKGYPAMHLQGICDSDMLFIDVYCAFPGSVHDSRVYKNSPVFDIIQSLPTQFHLLGDSAYPLSKTLIVPFRDNGHLSREEKNFNYRHSSARVCIEHCFGLLKGKFRKLKFLDMRLMKDIPSVIVTCCVLHNFILKREAFDNEDIAPCENDDFEQPNHDGEDNTQLEKRLEIMWLLA